MKRVWLYITVTCLISWTLASILFVESIDVKSVFYKPFAMGYMLIPALVAIVLQKFIYKEKIKRPLQVSFRMNRWFAVALITPLAMILLALLVSTLFPGISYSASGEGFLAQLPTEQQALFKQQIGQYSAVVLWSLTLLQGFLAACTINALFALGEELGWRGFMLRHLSRWSLSKVSLLTGVVWGLWHFPLILQGHNYPDHPVAGVFMMVVFCLLLSPAMTYLTLKSRSVIAAAVFHGSLNAFAGLPVLYLVGGNDLSNGITGYAGFIAIAVITLLFWLFDRFVTRERMFSRPVGDCLPAALEESLTEETSAERE